MPEIAYTILINHAPAASALLEALQSAEVEQRLDSAGIFRLRIALGQDSRGGYPLLDDDLFAPLTPVQVMVTLGATPPVTLLNGYVSHVRVDFTHGPVMEVVGMDASATVMNLEEKVRAWPNLSDGDIVTMICAEYGLIPVVTPTQPYRMATDTTVFQRSTDIRFIRQLAERNGYEFLIEYAPVVGLPMAYFGPPRTSLPHQAVLSVHFGTESNVEQFRVEYDMLAPAGAKAAAMDAADGSAVKGEAKSAKADAMGKESTLKAIPKKSVVLLSQTGLTQAGELQTAAQGAADRSTWVVSAEGSANPARVGALLEAAKPVLVRGAGDRYSGAYLVERVTHTWTPGDYAMQFRLRRNATGLKGTEVFR